MNGKAAVAQSSSSSSGSGSTSDNRRLSGNNKDLEKGDDKNEKTGFSHASEYPLQYEDCQGRIHSDTFSTSLFPRGYEYKTSGMCVLNYFAAAASRNPPALAPAAPDQHLVPGLVSCAALPTAEESDLLLQHVESKSLRLEWPDPCIALETRCYEARELGNATRASLHSIWTPDGVGGDDAGKWSSSSSSSQVAYVSLDCTQDYQSQVVEQVMLGDLTVDTTTAHNNKNGKDAEKNGVEFGVSVFVFIFLMAMTMSLILRGTRASSQSLRSMQQGTLDPEQGTRSYEMSSRRTMPGVPAGYQMAYTTPGDDDDDADADMPVAVATPITTTTTVTDVVPPRTTTRATTTSSSSAGPIVCSATLVLSESTTVHSSSEEVPATTTEVTATAEANTTEAAATNTAHETTTTAAGESSNEIV